MTAYASTPTALRIAEPQVFLLQLKEMGYTPEPFDTSDTPTTVVHSNGSNYGVVLGGCAERKDCKYLVLFANFSDLKNPPLDWVAKKNVEYDLIKVWVSDTKLLTYSTAMVGDGLSRSTFKASFDSFIAAGNSLARDAINDGLTASQTTKTK